MESAVARELHGVDTEWTTPAQLLATIADALRIANWQRAGGKKKDRPEPIERPGTRKLTVRTDLTPNEMAARLAQQRERQGR